VGLWCLDAVTRLLTSPVPVCLLSHSTRGIRPRALTSTAPTRRHARARMLSHRATQRLMRASSAAIKCPSHHHEQTITFFRGHGWTGTTGAGGARRRRAAHGRDWRNITKTKREGHSLIAGRRDRHISWWCRVGISAAIWRRTRGAQYAAQVVLGRWAGMAHSLAAALVRRHFACHLYHTS